MKGQYYYEQLTKEQKKQWDNNVKEQHEDDQAKKLLETEYPSFKVFISTSFTWYKTPEGTNYWYRISNMAPPSHQEPIYNSGVMLGVFIGILTGTLLTMATREWVWQLIGLDIALIVGIVYLYRRYRREGR